MTINLKQKNIRFQSLLLTHIGLESKRILSKGYIKKSIVYEQAVTKIMSLSLYGRNKGRFYILQNMRYKTRKKHAE